MLLGNSLSAQRVVSLPLLVAVAFGAVGLAYVLTPSKDELLTTIERDRLGASVLPLLRENWVDKTRSFTAATHSLSPQRLAKLAYLVRLTPRERLRSLLDARELPAFDVFAESLALSSIRYVDVISPKDAFELIAPAIDGFPQNRGTALLSVLGSNALAVNEPGLAAQVLLKVTQRTDSTWEDVQKMMAACQWSDMTDEAVPAAEHWFRMHESGLSAEQKDAVREEITQVALGASLPGKAFDMTLAELRALPRLTESHGDLVERARQAAVFAGRTKEVLVWIERYIATLPLATDTYAMLIKQPRPLAGPVLILEKWLRDAAQISDWNSLAENSYDHHQRLAALGDVASIYRVLALTAHLGRGEETAEFLTAMGTVPGRENLKLELARLLAANGDPARAQILFEEWTTAHPRDQTARYELANLIRGISDTDSATRAFEAFVHDYPKHDAAVKRLAEMRLRSGRLEEALDAFDSLSDDVLDPITLENYVTLAETVERPSSLLRGLHLMSKLDEMTSPELFDRLAEVHAATGDVEGAVRMLREGIIRTPDRPALRVRLAGLLLELGRADEAIDEALHPTLLNRVDAIGLALAALKIGVHRTEQVIAHFGGDIEHRVKLPVDARIELAIACSRVGQEIRASAIFDSIPENRDTFVPLVEARLTLEHYDVAERLAEQNIRESVAAQSRDWILLGDARSKMGHLVEAQEAYSHALLDLRQKISIRTPLSAQRDSR